MHRLLDTLKRIMQPPIRKKRPLARRSVPIPPKAKPLAPAAHLTNEQIQFLVFFTDHCKSDDFEAAYRAKLPEDFDLTFQSRDVEPKIDATLDQEQEEEKEEEEEMEVKEEIVVENVTEFADLFENSSCVYIPKKIVSV